MDWTPYGAKHEEVIRGEEKSPRGVPLVLDPKGPRDVY